MCSVLNQWVLQFLMKYILQLCGNYSLFLNCNGILMSFYLNCTKNGKYGWEESEVWGVLIQNEWTCGRIRHNPLHPVLFLFSEIKSINLQTLPNTVHETEGDTVNWWINSASAACLSLKHNKALPVSIRYTFSISVGSFVCGVCGSEKKMSALRRPNQPGQRTHKLTQLKGISISSAC